jgi:hypothetical protein
MTAEIDMISGLDETKRGDDADVGRGLKEAARQVYIAYNTDLIHTSFLNIGSSPGLQ